MTTTFTAHCRCHLTYLPLAFLLTAPGQASAQEAPPDAGSGRILIGRLAVEEAPAAESPLWIGVSAHAADDVLRRKLELAQDQGLVIDEVLPDSPAAKAGLKSEDVVVKVGESSVGQIEQLAKAVTGSQGRELKLQVLRRGRELTIGVTPARRPGESALIGEAGEKKEKEEAELKEARRRLEQMIEQLQRERQRAEAQAAGSAPRPVPPAGPPAGAAPPVAMRPGAAVGPVAPYPGAPPVGAPMMVMPWPGAAAAANLPDNMEVSINKRGQKPAVIVVKQGEKRWQTTENELDMLPAEARSYASRLLGKGMTPGPSATGWQMVPGGLPGRRIEWRVNEQGQFEPARTAETPGTVVKSVPGGIQVEIREGAESKSQPQPERREPLRRVEVRPAGETENRIHELQEQVEQLRRELERLRNARGSR